MKGESKPRQEDASPINDFNGHYQFLNNDHPAWVVLDGLLFPSAAIAYQAARTDNPATRQALAEVETYEQFKQIAQGIPNPTDWIGKRYRLMQRLLRDKFKRNKELGSKLAATHPRTLINTFKQPAGENEQYWGVVEGKGNNALGKILMLIRDEIKRGSDWDHWIADQGLQNDERMRPTVTVTVIKDEKPIDKLFLEKKSKFFLGNHQTNEFRLEHPSISKMHACIYFGTDLNIMLVDLGSSNGTFLLREGQTFKLEPLKPVPLEKNDLVKFGLSERRYKVDIDCEVVQQYMKEQEDKAQEEIKRIKINRRSRSRSRSPKISKNRN